MLTKLLKYDLKKILKFLSVFYLLALFFALLTRMFGGLGDSLALTIIESVCSGATISMMFSILINCFMRSWVLFRASLYGDESYLTHTLPVKRETHFASKAITAALSVLLSLGVIVVILLISYGTKANLDLIRSFIKPVAALFDISLSTLLIGLVLILYLEFVCAIQWGFLGMIAGHRFNRSKIALSVLIGFGAYLASQVLLVLIMLAAGLCDPDFMNVFTTNDLFAVDTATARTIVLIAVGAYAALAAAGYLLNVMLLKKGVNVD